MRTLKNSKIILIYLGVEIDSGTQDQLQKIASLPIIHHHVAAMPDAHVRLLIDYTYKKK